MAGEASTQSQEVAMPMGEDKKLEALRRLSGTPNSDFIMRKGILSQMGSNSDISSEGDSAGEEASPLDEFRGVTTIQNVQDEFLFEGRADSGEEVRDWRILLTANEIQLGVQYIAAILNKKFRNQPVVITGILKGVFIFMTDLCKLLTIPYSVYFLEASSYKDGEKQSESVEFLSKIVPSKFVGCKVVLLDELFDNGKTMFSIRQALLDEPELHLEETDIFTCTLFQKTKQDRKYPCPDLVAHTCIPDLWLVGYGLDHKGTKRGWPHIFAIPRAEGCDTAEDIIFSKTDEEAAQTMLASIRKTQRARMEELTEEMQ